MDQPLRQKTCRWCHGLFAICPACDRGHAYCSARCRLLARRRSVQAAKARHQRSPEGRLDHRDHQRTYRTRCRVRDHSSPAVLRYARLHALEVPPAPAPEPTRCVVCGRVSRWLIPARWPRVDRRRGNDHARAARRDPGREQSVIPCRPLRKRLRCGERSVCAVFVPHGGVCFSTVIGLFVNYPG